MRLVRSPVNLPRLIPILLGGLVSFSSVLGCGGHPPPLTARASEKVLNREPLEAQVLAQFWQVSGEQIVTNKGTPIRLQGIALGNQVWGHTEIPSSHHRGEDYKKIDEMGMNSVRFYLSANTFESFETPGVYKESGWNWLDQNIEWAKENGIRLVLNMHKPWGIDGAAGQEAQFWTNQEYQDRFVNLWRVIAERYRAEPNIVGFDILNEPHPPKSQLQWKELVNRVISEVREVNQHHIFFVERVNAVGADWTENAARNFVRVSDEQVVYEFHFYKPYHFTHQNASFSNFAAREGWYPDHNVPEAEWYNLTTRHQSHSEYLSPGNSDWTMLETEPFLVQDKELVLGKPILVCDSGEGRVVFDSLSLTRLKTLQEDTTISQEEDALVEKQEAPEVELLFEVDLDTRRGWFFWSENGLGKAEFLPEGHGDFSALSLSGTTGLANLGSDPLRFPLEQGFEYQLQGLARAENLGEKSRCGLRLEFYSSKVPIVTRGKEYLEQELDAYLQWGKKEGVPVYMGEWGTIRDSFLPGRGGELWVRDMLTLIDEKNVSHSYHSYHEMAFGLFRSEGKLPREEDINEKLYRAFTEVPPPTAKADSDVSPRGVPREGAPEEKNYQPSSSQVGLEQAEGDN